MVAPDLALKIDTARLWQTITDLGKLGAYRDTRTGLIGVNRPTMSAADISARALLVSWLRGAGLSVRVDEVGNIFGRREGLDPSAPVVMMGSHIDSVPTAGIFDGPLGVLGALEVIRTLNELGVTTRRPLEIACFTEEEGVRFGTDMLGSAVVAGRIPLEAALTLTDRNGASLGEELNNAGWAGSTRAQLDPPFAYLECHIEQGPILQSNGLDIGVVTGTQSISWQELTFIGKAAHAGATPTEFRVDAGLAAAGLISYARAMVDSGDFGALRATVGHVTLLPDAVNIVPEFAELTLDLRNPDEQMMVLAEREVERHLAVLQATQPGLEITARPMVRTRPVPFDADLQELISDVTEELGLTGASLLSGAGHDAQELAAISPTGMIFVPGEYDGVSHSPREYSSPEACARGVRVLGHAALRLANRA